MDYCASLNNLSSIIDKPNFKVGHCILTKDPVSLASSGSNSGAAVVGPGSSMTASILQLLLQISTSSLPELTVCSRKWASELQLDVPRYASIRPTDRHLSHGIGISWWVHPDTHSNVSSPASAAVGTQMCPAGAVRHHVAPICLLLQHLDSLAICYWLLLLLALLVPAVCEG